MRLKHWLRPRSLLRLLLVGFVLAALPLLGALLAATWYVDQLAHQSRDAVDQAVQVTEAGRELAIQLTDMERTARQYSVLGDDDLLNRYSELRSDFVQDLVAVEQVVEQSDRRTLIMDLQVGEAEIFQALNEGADDGLAEQFGALHELAQTLSLQGHTLIDRAAADMQETARQAQQILVWHLVAVIPITIAFVIFFVSRINRPIRQMGRAINRLGAGDFDREISIQGPRDLEELGQELDWLRQQLRELEAQKQRFLQHVSHELKTPLTGIREGSNLLSDGVAGALSPEQQEIAAVIRDNSQGLQTQIENLLHFTRRGGLRQHQSEQVALDEIVTQMAARHHLAMKARKVTLRTEISPALYFGDRGKLNAIVDNLLSNAVKYSPSGGEITVTLAEERGAVVLRVRDQGVGVPEEERDQVFEVFFQGRNRASGHVKGSGVGLAIVRDFVVDHGGTISVDNHPEGGAVFQVELPREGRSS